MNYCINSIAEISRVDRRTVLRGGAMFVGAALASSLAAPGLVRAEDRKLKMAFATPFSGQDSFSGTIGGIQAAAKDLGIEMTISDAAFDVKKQNDQITALVASKPDALIILAFDPVGSSQAIAAATASDVPVFLIQGLVPHATAVTTSIHNDYGMGQETARYMVDRLGGTGKIAVMELAFNENWNMRTLGMRDYVAQHPGIEIVGNWTFDATGKTTPRTAADAFLAANDDLAAIWCAWDNAAMEASLAIMAAGKADTIFTVGADGGSAAFEVLRSGGPFVYTVAQSFYVQAYNIVAFAHRHLNGGAVPRVVVEPVFAVDKAMLDAAGERANDYDKPGVAAELGWTRAL